MKQEYSAGIIVYYIERNQVQYLLLEHRGHAWGFAKGRIEPGEIAEQTAMRETKEETGLIISPDTSFKKEVFYNFTLSSGERIKKSVQYFIGLAPSKDVILSYEHYDYVWLSYNAALEKLTHLNAKEVLEEAHKHIILQHNIL